MDVGMTIFTTRNSLTFVNTTVIASGKKPGGASKFWCMICSRVRKRQRITSRSITCKISWGA